MTTDDDASTAIPEAGYSFSILKRAQALGDAETLAAHSRRVVRLHLDGGTPIRALKDVFAKAVIQDQGQGSGVTASQRRD